MDTLNFSLCISLTVALFMAIVQVQAGSNISPSVSGRNMLSQWPNVTSMTEVVRSLATIIMPPAHQPCTQAIQQISNGQVAQIALQRQAIESLKINQIAMAKEISPIQMQPTYDPCDIDAYSISVTSIRTVTELVKKETTTSLISISTRYVSRTVIDERVMTRHLTFTKTKATSHITTAEVTHTVTTVSTRTLTQQIDQIVTDSSLVLMEDLPLVAPEKNDQVTAQNGKCIVTETLKQVKVITMAPTTNQSVRRVQMVSQCAMTTKEYTSVGTVCNFVLSTMTVPAKSIKTSELGNLRDFEDSSSIIAIKDKIQATGPSAIIGARADPERIVAEELALERPIITKDDDRGNAIQPKEIVPITGPIKADVIRGGPIEADFIPSGPIDSGLIPSGLIQADLIPSGTIEAGLIAGAPIEAGFITGAPIEAGLTTNDLIEAGLITSGLIETGPITMGPIPVSATRVDLIPSGPIEAGLILASPTISPIRPGLIPSGTIKAGLIPSSPIEAGLAVSSPRAILFTSGAIGAGLITTIPAARPTLTSPIGATVIRAGLITTSSTNTSQIRAVLPSASQITSPIRTALAITSPIVTKITTPTTPIIAKITSNASIAPTAKLTTPAIKSTTPTIKSTTPTTKSTTIAIKSTTPATKLTTPATKLTTPATKLTTPAIKSTTPITKSTTPITKSTTPITKLTTPAIKLTTIATKSTTPTTTPTINLTTKPGTPTTIIPTTPPPTLSLQLSSCLASLSSTLNAAKPFSTSILLLEKNLSSAKDLFTEYMNSARNNRLQAYQALRPLKTSLPRSTDLKKYHSAYLTGINAESSFWSKANNQLSSVLMKAMGIGGQRTTLEKQSTNALALFNTCNKIRDQLLVGGAKVEIITKPQFSSAATLITHDKATAFLNQILKARNAFNGYGSPIEQKLSQLKTALVLVEQARSQFDAAKTKLVQVQNQSTQVKLAAQQEASQLGSLYSSALAQANNRRTELLTLRITARTLYKTFISTVDNVLSQLR